jgi:peptidoglycan/xylan/chitin deacetylase (PgdA/CDA1 family)
MTAFEDLGDDIAVHTWTHPYMTTLDNMALLGEFGWTMEIIHNSTGGRLPKYWRPPYGDSDNRVSAIAKEVFGLQTIIWNQEYGYILCYCVLLENNIFLSLAPKIGVSARQAAPRRQTAFMLR